MSVEELVKRLRKKQMRVHDLSGVGYVDDSDCQEAADKLEELAAENERVRRERVEANNEWRKAYNELTVKTEAALTEKEKEIARNGVMAVTPEQIHAADKATDGKIPLILLIWALIAAEEQIKDAFLFDS